MKTEYQCMWGKSMRDLQWGLKRIKERISKACVVLESFHFYLIQYCYLLWKGGKSDLRNCDCISVWDFGAAYFDFQEASPFYCWELCLDDTQ